MCAAIAKQDAMSHSGRHGVSREKCSSLTPHKGHSLPFPSLKAFSEQFIRSPEDDIARQIKTDSSAPKSCGSLFPKDRKVSKLVNLMTSFPEQARRTVLSSDLCTSHQLLVTTLPPHSCESGKAEGSADHELTRLRLTKMRPSRRTSLVSGQPKFIGPEQDCFLPLLLGMIALIKIYLLGKSCPERSSPQPFHPASHHSWLRQPPRLALGFLFHSELAEACRP